MIDKDYSGKIILDQIKSYNYSYELNNNSFAIGAYDKIYYIHKNNIIIFKFNQSGDDINNIFKYLKTITLQEDIGNKIIHVGTSFFGILIETENKFFVIKNNEEIVDLNPNNEGIIDWRIFNRSKRYVNQIHIIFKNRIEVVSFYDDYFVNQKSKLIGCNYNEKYFNKHS